MEEQKTVHVSDMELMQKLSRFMRRTRVGGFEPGMHGRKDLVGPGPEGPENSMRMNDNPGTDNGAPFPALQGMEHRDMPPIGPQGMEHPPMPPIGLQGMDRPPMPPIGPQGINRPPMPQIGPQGMDRPPMPPIGPQGMDRPPMPPIGPQGTGRPPMSPFGPQGMHRPPLPREKMLVLIGENPDGIRQKALSEKLGINQSSTSELVNKLESGGYIVRKVDPEDRRATLLFLTELGQARAAEVRSEQEASLGSVFSRLTEDEKQTLAVLLDKLLGDNRGE